MIIFCAVPCYGSGYTVTMPSKEVLSANLLSYGTGGGPIPKCNELLALAKKKVTVKRVFKRVKHTTNIIMNNTDAQHLPPLCWKANFEGYQKSYDGVLEILLTAMLGHDPQVLDFAKKLSENLSRDMRLRAALTAHITIPARYEISQKIESCTAAGGGPFWEAYKLMNFAECTVPVQEVYQEVQRIAFGVTQIPVADRPSWALGIMTSTQEQYQHELEDKLLAMLGINDDQQVKQSVQALRAAQEVKNVVITAEWAQLFAAARRSQTQEVQALQQ